MKRSDLALTMSQRLLLLLLSFVVCYFITALSVYFVGKLMPDNFAATQRIGSVIQDVVLFVVPSVLTAMLITRRPAELLCITSKVNPKIYFLVFAIMCLSIPAQEAVIYWNENITLPAWLHDYELIARDMEERVAQGLQQLLSDTSVVALCLNILIIGVAAGFSEELLFRGTLQRLLTTGGVNRHIAVWTVAAIFSLVHFQFYGFVPRMLLGAYFGYLLLWTGSIWVPMLAHILNNSLYVITAWVQLRFYPEEPFMTQAVLYPWWSIAISAILTGAVIFVIYKMSAIYRQSLK